MQIFNDYSRYYDLLYKDKEYLRETAFVLQQLESAEKPLCSVLDLGCGTGRHALEIAKRGIEVTGVDISPVMLEMAAGNLLSFHEKKEFSLPEYIEADVRNFRCDKHFDAAVSLFHVMSYQTTEDSFLKVLETVKAHVTPGGLFLFDFWYGPGVLTMRPEKRTKTLEDETVIVNRLARPELFLNKNVVNVNYDIHLTDKTTGITRHLQETHPMRYWFMPELLYLTTSAGFSFVKSGRWMDDAEPSDRDWAAWMLVRL